MRVPSSLAIYVAAAELTNYTQRNSFRHPRRKPPHKSLPPQLAQWGNKKHDSFRVLILTPFTVCRPLLGNRVNLPRMADLVLLNRDANQNDPVAKSKHYQFISFLLVLGSQCSELSNCLGLHFLAYFFVAAD